MCYLSTLESLPQRSSCPHARGEILSYPRWQPVVDKNGQRPLYDRDEIVEVAAWYRSKGPYDQRLSCMKVRWNGRVDLITQFFSHNIRYEKGELCHYHYVASKTHQYVFCHRTRSMVWVLKKVEPLDTKSNGKKNGRKQR